MVTQQEDTQLENETRPRVKKLASPNLACEACRALKIKCIPSDPKVTAKCQRCAKRDELCVHKVPSRRKQRKRIDTQIKELESEILALSEVLMARNAGETSNSSISPSSSQQNSCRDADDLPDEVEVDCFHRFVRDLSPTFPLITFPPDTEVWQVRKEAPILFLAIVAVSSHFQGEELCRRMNYKVARKLAELVVIEGNKSLELLQAILVTVAFTFPPDNFSKLVHFQNSQIAAGMVQDLHLATSPIDVARSEKPISGIVGFGHSDPSFLPGSSLLESRRALLGCYILCTGISHTLRRTNPLSYSDWMEDCIALFENSENSLDRKLAAHARLSRILDEFSRNIPLGCDVKRKASFSEPITQHHVEMFNRKLARWYQTTDSELIKGSLQVSFHTTEVYINEIALHFDHQAEDFRPPYVIAAHKRNADKAPTRPPPAAYMQSITICMSSAQSAINAFLAIDVLSLRCNTTVTFVRMMYCVVVLAKLSGSLKGSGSILADKLDIESYIERLLRHLDVVAGDGQCAIADKFHGVIKNMAAWHHANKNDHSRPDGDDNIIEPLKHLNVNGKSLRKALHTVQGTQQPSIAQFHNPEPIGSASTYSEPQLVGEAVNTVTPYDTMDFGVPDFPLMPMDFDASFDYSVIGKELIFADYCEVFGNFESLVADSGLQSSGTEVDTFRQ